MGRERERERERKKVGEYIFFFFCSALLNKILKISYKLWQNKAKRMEATGTSGGGYQSAHWL